MCEASMTLAGLLAISIGINILLTYKLEKSTKKSKKLAGEIRRKSSILGIAMYSIYGKL
jgi:hypothetical protein